MRIINIKDGGNMITTKMATVIIDPTDRQPCWYANFENSDKRADAKWIVGVKDGKEKDEYSFKASSVGDVTNDVLWAYMISPDFAIGLVESFKRGGKTEADRWVKNATI